VLRGFRGRLGLSSASLNEKEIGSEAGAEEDARAELQASRSLTSAEDCGLNSLEPGTWSLEPGVS